MQLEWLGPVAVPDTTPETAWLGRIIQLEGRGDRLFTLERNDKTVLELTTGGEFVRTYGRRGEGPGELSNPLQLAVGADRLFVLDLGNGKIAAFRLGTGELLTEIRLEGFYYGLTVVGDTLLATVPGRNSRAFDLFDFDGRHVGSYGNGSFLPRVCAYCRIVGLPDASVAVVDSELPGVFVYRLDGEWVDRMEFPEVTDLRLWKDEFRKRIGAGPAAPAGRIWITDARASATGVLLLAVSPERVHERPRELWEVVPGEGVVRRHRYTRLQAGAYVAGFPEIFAVDRLDGGIHAFRPTGDGGR